MLHVIFHWTKQGRLFYSSVWDVATIKPIKFIGAHSFVFPKPLMCFSQYENNSTPFLWKLNVLSGWEVRRQKDAMPQIVPWAKMNTVLQQLCRVKGYIQCLSSFSPLETLLLLSLLPDLRELPFVVLPRSGFLGFAPGVVLHTLHLFLPSFHQLVISLADLLFLSTRHQN